MTFGRDDDDERFACDTVALSICLIRYTAAEKSVAWTISWRQRLRDACRGKRFVGRHSAGMMSDSVRIHSYGELENNAQKIS